MLWAKFWLVSPEIWGSLDLCWSHRTRSFRTLPCPCWVTCLGPAVCKAPWVRSRIMIAHERLWLSSFQICKFIHIKLICCFLLAKQILPQLGELLQGGPSQLGNSDESIAAACNTVLRLMSANTDTSKKVINNAVIQSLIDLSEDKWVFF